MSQYDPPGWQNQPGDNQPYGGQPSGYGSSQGGNYPGQYPQGPQGQYPPGYPQGGFPGMQQEAPSATTALVCGILGFLCIIPAVMGVIYGKRTQQEIAASGGRLGGAGKGQAGLILGWVWIGLTVATVVLYIIAFGVAASQSGSY